MLGQSDLDIHLQPMKQHKPTNCGAMFPLSRVNLSNLGWGRGVRGIYTTDYGRAIDHYNLVVCPSCGNSEPDARLRVFGIFSPRAFKFVLLLALGAIALGGLVQLLKAT